MVCCLKTHRIQIFLCWLLLLQLVFIFGVGVKLEVMCSAFPLPSQLLLLMRKRWIRY